MRTDVSFRASDGTTLRGWHYRPQSTRGDAPIIVMAHGISATKEMWLDRYAEVFAAAGLGVLVYDHRNLGDSDGEPRQEVNPWMQASDYRDAITFAETLPQVDAGRIGIWGTSYSGGLVLMVGAFDRRVSCVCAQVPVISGSENVRRMVRCDRIADLHRAFHEERRSRAAGRAPATLPVVGADPNAEVLLPNQEAWKFFTDAAAARAPNWRNELTMHSAEMLLEYEPGLYIDRISPTPLLLIVATGDVLCPLEVTLAAYQRALYPKNLVLLKGGHFVAYVEQFEAASAAARDWFVQHMLASGVARQRAAST